MLRNRQARTRSWTFLIHGISVTIQMKADDMHIRYTSVFVHYLTMTYRRQHQPNMMYDFSFRIIACQ